MSVLRFDNVSKRYDSGHHALTDVSFEVAPGDSGFITVRAVGEADESEDVLFLEVLEPVPTRRAITLTVPE